MRQLIQTKKKSGKQNKKKWMKTINTNQLMNQMEKANNDQIRSTFKKPVVIQSVPKKSEPLDPNRFKRKQVDPKLQSQTEKNILRRMNLEEIQASKKQKQMQVEELNDVWGDPVAPKKRANQPKKRVQEQDIFQTPAVMKPMGGQSYNPSTEDFEKLVDKIIQVEGEKPKKVIVPKVKKIQKHTVRIRNKIVRQSQLDAMERKRQRLRQHYQNNMGMVQKQVQKHIQKGLDTARKNEQQKQQLIKQRKSGWISKGPNFVKSRSYQYKADIIPTLEATELSKMPFREQIIRDRMDSVFRRGLIEPKAYSANPRVKKSMKVRPPATDTRPYW